MVFLSGFKGYDCFLSVGSSTYNLPIRLGFPFTFMVYTFSTLTLKCSQWRFYFGFISLFIHYKGVFVISQ